jgi:hypothetical protein
VRAAQRLSEKLTPIYGTEWQKIRGKALICIGLFLWK